MFSRRGKFNIFNSFITKFKAGAPPHSNPGAGAGAWRRAWLWKGLCLSRSRPVSDRSVFLTISIARAHSSTCRVHANSRRFIPTQKGLNMGRNGARGRFWRRQWQWCRLGRMGWLGRTGGRGRLGGGIHGAGGHSPGIVHRTTD